MDTPFAILENILRQDTGKETVLYVFRGHELRTPNIYAFTEGSQSIVDTKTHVCMSFEDDLGGKYKLFAPDNFPSFCRKVGESIGESPNGPRMHYEHWQINDYPWDRECPISEKPLIPTPQTAYLHCWDGTVEQADTGKNTISLPTKISLLSADAEELRHYLAEFEHKIPARYVLSIPGLTYELNTNMKLTGEIDSRISTGVGGGSADDIINNFEKQAQVAASKIALLKPYHKEMKAFVLTAQRAYFNRKEHF